MISYNCNITGLNWYIMVFLLNLSSSSKSFWKGGNGISVPVPCSHWSLQSRLLQTEWAQSCIPETRRHGCRSHVSVGTEVHKLSWIKVTFMERVIEDSRERKEDWSKVLETVRSGLVPARRGEWWHPGPPPSLWVIALQIEPTWHFPHCQS